MRLLWIEFGALTLCASLLVCAWVERRRRQRRLNSIGDHFPGRGFDTAPVKQRLIQLRQDPVALVTLRPLSTPSHDQFVAVVRRSLTQLSYFRSVQPAGSESADQRGPEGPA